MDLLEDCANALAKNSASAKQPWAALKVAIGKLTLVNVAGVRLLPGLGALLLVARGSSRLLASLLLLGGCLSGWGLAAGGGSLLSFGRHFE